MEIIALNIPFLAYILLDKFFTWLEKFGIKFDLEEPKKKAPAPQSQPSAQQLRGSNQWQ